MGDDLGPGDGSRFVRNDPDAGPDTSNQGAHAAAYDPLRAAATLLAALATQWLCTRLWRAPRFEPHSALISALSLSLLLRADAFWPLPLAAAS